MTAGQASRIAPVGFGDRVDRAGIAARVPHAGRMCLLDSVEHWDATTIRCRSGRHRPVVDGRPHPLARSGRMPATAAIEFAAQAMAVHGALIGEAEAAVPAVPGMLAAVRSVVLAGRWIDPDASALDIVASRLAGDAGQILYDFEVTAAAGTVAASHSVARGRAVVLLRPAAA